MGYNCRVAIVLLVLLASIAALIAVAVIQDTWGSKEYGFEVRIAAPNKPIQFPEPLKHWNLCIYIPKYMHAEGSKRHMCANTLSVVNVKSDVAQMSGSRFAFPSSVSLMTDGPCMVNVIL